MGPGFVVLLGKKCMENMNMRVVKFGLYLTRFLGERETSVSVCVCVCWWIVRVDSGRGSDGHRIPEGGAKRGLVWESFGKLWDLERESIICFIEPVL